MTAAHLTSLIVERKLHLLFKMQIVGTNIKIRVKIKVGNILSYESTKMVAFGRT